jgi:beta-glucuronidase
MTDELDPFAHLHDESYADGYETPRADYRGLIAMGGRARMSLHGAWHFTRDLFDEGLRQKLFADPPTPPSEWRKPRDFDEWAAEEIAVPGCWNLAHPEWLMFEGAGWYARRFDWQASAPRLFLRVGAANYAARVFLNGRFLTLHLGGSTPFFVELTSQVRRGENHLLIQVENRRRPDRVPMHHFDWFNYGGLYREVDLLALPAVFLRDVRIGWRDAAIAVEVTLSDPVAATARVTIPALGIAQDVAVANGRGAATIAAQPDLWSPETPHLYDVIVECGDDRVTDRVGFRDIVVRGEEILLNGTSIYLRGVCVHEDDVALGKSTSEADLRRRVAHAKELGCNLLRLAHYPHHERMAEIADEVGLLLWEEIPVYWAIDFTNPATYADAENQLLELIARDRNRASVIIWGVGNENADTNARFFFMSRLAEAARRADPTRLVSAACLINRQTFRIEDRLADCLDIVGLNEYFGWYEPDMSLLERLLVNSRPGKPVVISETGGDALAGHHGKVTELFTEEKQADIHRQQLAILDLVPYVRGYIPWLLYDFRTERRQTRFQRGYNRKGLIAEDKATKKLGFHLLAEHYARLIEDGADQRAVSR